MSDAWQLPAFKFWNKSSTGTIHAFIFNVPPPTPVGTCRALERTELLQKGTEAPHCLQKPQRADPARRSRVCTNYLILLPVFMRIHCGMGRFCFCFLARKRLILNVL